MQTSFFVSQLFRVSARDYLVCDNATGSLILSSNVKQDSVSCCVCGPERYELAALVRTQEFCSRDYAELYLSVGRNGY